MHNQPFLHDLVTAVRAPGTVLSGQDGQLRPHGAQGWLVADVRHLSELTVLVDNQEPVSLGHVGPRFVGAVRHLGEEITEPTVRLERLRDLDAAHLRETVELVNDSRQHLTTTLAIRLAADLAPILTFRDGRTPAPVSPRNLSWQAGSCTTTVTTDRPADRAEHTDHLRLEWDLHLAPRSRTAVTLELTATSSATDAVFVAATPPARTIRVTSADPELNSLVTTGLDDLDALLLADSAAPSDLFLAAGAPWYLTLFGRDSLWAARFTLPFGTDLAIGTLRTLARRQGTKHDPTTAEQPGKMPHEIRRVPSGVDSGDGLPPVYYGTIDATPLWLILLHDAWRWGAPIDDLLDPMRRALDWVLTHDTFLSYQDELGRGLANQGWKDSADSIQDSVGVLATAPVALAEAQAYAHRAAVNTATLLDAFDLPGAPEARKWAAAMASRFRATFWTGGYPALALDADGKPVDSLASNLGHLLDTGLLDADESATVAGWLANPRLNSGYGLRTLDGDHPFFNPLGYHTGSVWPHDTAIAVDGLARTGHGPAAAALAAGIVRAGTRFSHRLPELYGGWSPAQGPLLDYPSTCRPQAWSAASALVLVRAALGLDADVPNGRVTVRPAPEFAAWFPMVVEGIKINGDDLTVEVDADGRATVRTRSQVPVGVGA
jgi:glycogen debranching enzyme